MTAPTAAALAPDLEAALLRLKLSAIRRMAPEVLVTAKVQRWAPDELLRTLLEAELGSRDASNARARLRAAGFPVRKTLEEFLVAESSVPRPTFDYLASLEWIRARENLVLVGPAGTGKSHTLIALGHAAVEQGFRVRYFAAASLAEALYRGLADNSVGRLIEGLLRADLVIVDDLGFAPLDDTGAQLLFRFVAAAYERRSLGVTVTWNQVPRVAGSSSATQSGGRGPSSRRTDGGWTSSAGLRLAAGLRLRRGSRSGRTSAGRPGRSRRTREGSTTS